MGANFIPGTLDGFFCWQNDFYSRVTEQQGSFKIDDAKIEALTAAKNSYEQAFSRASNRDSASRADRVERDKCTAEYKTAIRSFINACIRYNPDVSDYERKYLGLVIPDTKPTPAAVPVTHPLLSVDFSQPQRHTIRIKDEKLDSKRKPAGVKECEIWYKIADKQPTHNSELHYAGGATKPSFIIDFGVEERGKEVWYRGRWINTRGKHGPWSVYTSAIIA